MGEREAGCFWAMRYRVRSLNGEMAILSPCLTPMSTHGRLGFMSARHEFRLGASGVLRFALEVVRLPLLAILTLFAPVVEVLCGGAFLLGLLVSIAFKISSVGPSFPFWSVVGISLHCALLAMHGPLEPSMPEYKDCTSVGALPSDTPATFKKTWPQFFTPYYFAEKVSLMSSLYTHRYDSVDHLRLGAMPLVVLTAKNTWGDTPAGIQFTQTFLKSGSLSMKPWRISPPVTCTGSSKDRTITFSWIKRRRLLTLWTKCSANSTL